MTRFGMLRIQMRVKRRLFESYRMWPGMRYKIEIEELHGPVDG